MLPTVEDKQEDEEGEGERVQSEEDGSDDGDEEDYDKVPRGYDVQQPPKKITRKINGQIRKYNFMKTMKSLDELDKFRFKVIPKKDIKQ
jgi:hypothetical protein